jgi:hypothetical protein
MLGYIEGISNITLSIMVIIFVITILLYLEFKRFIIQNLPCYNHKPKKLILTDFGHLASSRTVGYCKTCKRFEQIEE